MAEPIGPWRLTSSAPGAWSTPADIHTEAEWLNAPVPGTVAAALRDAGRFDIMDPPELDDRDWWYRCEVEGGGRKILSLDGLATIAEVWLDDELILRSDSMYAEHRVDVELQCRHVLALCFRALAPVLADPRPVKRARWRSTLVTPGSLLGRMNGWCPPVHAVGPWRDIRIVPADALAISNVHIAARVDGARGDLLVRLQLNRAVPGIMLGCDSHSVAMQEIGDALYEARLGIPDVILWWPHTHGAPHLYDLRVETRDGHLSLGRTGFRTISVDRCHDGQGFSLLINGTPVFCRGALWTGVDLVSLASSRTSCEPLLRLARDAGMNMIRISGTTAYESRAFHDLCDELGRLVWQDFMFANMDYPAQDAQFLESVEREAQELLQRTMFSPSLAVLCGGSEVMQEAAMIGLPQSAWSSSLFEEVLPGLCAEARPDVPFIANTPFGGELPFEPWSGVSHYYGVSAYMRPIEDARLAQVRFASECLGFANIPDGPVSLDAERAAVAQPLWGQRYDRDMAATWFFEDVRNHYLRELYQIDPAALRRNDPERYLDMSRAVNAELMEAVFAQFRRMGSPTAGGLVWFLRDVSPGAGWGVVGADLEPKSVWYALRRSFRPLQVLLVDEGLNGLWIHVINERDATFTGEIELTCLRDGSVPVLNVRQALSVAARGATKISATSLNGGFFDSSYAYRFGPPSHTVTFARLRDASGHVMAEAFHFPTGRHAEQEALGMQATVSMQSGKRFLHLLSNHFAQNVHISDTHHRPSDNWFHLAPGEEKTIELHPRLEATDRLPSGSVRALNGLETIHYEASS